MTANGIERVAVVGTGVIGASWAAYFLARGLAVSATDPAPGARERLMAAVARHWPTLEEIGLEKGASIANLTFHDDLESALSGAQFVQENGPEREDLKLDLLKRIDAALPEDVVIASSTSGLLMSRMQRSGAKRFISCRSARRVSRISTMRSRTVPACDGRCRDRSPICISRVAKRALRIRSIISARRCRIGGMTSARRD